MDGPVMTHETNTALTVSFQLNGEAKQAFVSTETRLLDVLREHLGMTGTKMGCSIGRCGACLALVDGIPRNTCLTFAWQVEGHDVITIEGIDALPHAQTIKAGLLEESAFQCGHCAPGFVVALTGFLSENPNADDDAVVASLEGNICRCTGYSSIVRGALNAAARVRRETGG